MNPERSFSDPRISPFASELVSVYGESGAYKIMTSIQYATDEALVNVPLVKQPNLTFQIGVDIDPYSGQTPEGLIAYADAPKEKITLILSSTTSSEEIASLLFDFIHHEIGHIAHDQFCEDKASFYRSPFGAACTEGIADLAECVNFGYYIQNSGLTSDKATTIARQELDKTLSGYYNQHDYYDFLFGDDQLQNRGYFIGSYVVSSLVLYEDLSHEKTMQLPLKRFEDFAKAELL